METCKNCGACPTCGRQYGYGFYHPYIPYYPYITPVIQPSWSAPNTAGDTVWTFGHTTNTNSFQG